MLVNEFITGGYMERHLNKMRGIYKMKHDTLMNALKVFPKSCRIKGENAGVHLLLELSGDAKEQWFIEKAAEEGIRLQGLSQCCLGRNENPQNATLILGYAVLKQKDMEAAVNILYELFCARNEKKDEIKIYYQKNDCSLSGCNALYGNAYRLWKKY